MCGAVDYSNASLFNPAYTLIRAPTRYIWAPTRYIWESFEHTESTVRRLVLTYVHHCPCHGNNGCQYSLQSRSSVLSDR